MAHGDAITKMRVFVEPRIAVITVLYLDQIVRFSKIFSDIHLLQLEMMSPTGFNSQSCILCIGELASTELAEPPMGHILGRVMS